MAICSENIQADRRRTFWTTQPDACGDTSECGRDCGAVGLAFLDGSTGQKTFATNDWVRSLVLNILLTDARKPDTPCGYRPGGQSGHWSDSYRTDGEKVGTTVRFIPKSSSVRDSMLLARATIIADLAKLINMGIAKTINVITEYLGNNTMSAAIEIIAPDGTGTRVGLTGTRNAASWAWR